MIGRRLLGAAFTLLLLQLGTSSSWAEDKELFVSDLLSGDYTFSSGFRDGDCEIELVGLADRALSLLTAPIGTFKRRPLPEKIKEVHAAVTLLRDLSYVDIRQGFIELPGILADAKVEQGLLLRLKFLGESSRKKLATHTREILVITHKLLPFVAYVHKFYPDVRQDLLNFFTIALELKSNSPLLRVDHDLRSLAFGSVAILKTARLIERQNPERAVLEAIEALLEGTKEDWAGHAMGHSLEAALMMQLHILAGIDAFLPSELGRIEQGMIESLKDVEMLSGLLISQGPKESRRFPALIGQLDGLLQKPAMARLPRLKAVIEGIREHFRRPRDPKKLH